MLTRRQLVAALCASCAAARLPADQKNGARVYHLLGIPLRTGSLYPGSENDAQAYRDVRLLEQLQAAKCNVVDDGNLAIPSYLPHHSIPPIRNWPGPRIVWDLVAERIAPWVRNAGSIPVLLGCDCSVVVGTTQALLHAGAGDVHVIYMDGDFDDAAPEPARCQSAAAAAVWLLTHASPFWAGPALEPSRVSVVGWSRPSQSKEAGLRSYPLAEMRGTGVESTARRILESIPSSASILLHLDIDCMRQQDTPAAYFPHPEGMSLAEAGALFGILAKDRRLRIIEISEYCALRDSDRRCAAQLARLLVEGLKG